MDDDHGRVPLRALITRLPLMLRSLVLVPLLAVGIDQLRVSFVCGPDVRSCLETAGDGRFGVAAMLILAVYTSAIAGLVGRIAQRRRAPALLWIVATAAVWAVCGGQAILAELFGGGAMLGGGWLQLAALGAAAGAPVALARPGAPAPRAPLHPPPPPPPPRPPVRPRRRPPPAPPRAPPGPPSSARAAPRRGPPRTSFVSPGPRGMAHRLRWRSSPVASTSIPHRTQGAPKCRSPSASSASSAGPPSARPTPPNP